MRHLFFLAFCVGLFAQTAQADVPFTKWKEQKFSLFSGNKWSASAQKVDVTANGTVSLLWTRVPQELSQSRAASWGWSVSQSVVATPLDQKGGDDRNLSLYFVFMPADVARANKDASIRKLLNVEEARVMLYVWGGDYPKGTVLPSPYLGARGATIVLRSAGTGSYTESIDLARDYKRAFGGDVTTLVGLALSADSDDTDGVIKAQLKDLRLR